MVPLEQAAKEAQLEGCLQPRANVWFRPLALICLPLISIAALLYWSAHRPMLPTSGHEHIPEPHCPQGSWTWQTRSVRREPLWVLLTQSQVHWHRKICKG